MGSANENYLMRKNFWGKTYGLIKLGIVGALIILEVLIIYELTVWLREYSAIAYAALEVLGLCLIVALFSADINESFKMRWMLIILLLPVIGMLLYFLWGRLNPPKRELARMEKLQRKIMANVETQDDVWREFKREFPNQTRMVQCMMNQGFALYNGTDGEYHSLGEQHFEVLFRELERAQKFILMEYFIIGEGEVWDRIHEILARKVQEGVEVMLLYDDIGSLTTLKNNFKKRMERDGINTRIFNPVGHHIQKLYMNYRNHQKITVIDGNVAFTGGVNLSDEYANLYEKHGHWKDTGVMIRGEAVKSLTATFMIMWGIASHDDNEFSNYCPTYSVENGQGYFLPIFDGPSNNPQNPAEDMYKQIIANSTKYCYITTPYLIIDSSLIDELRLAARSGVDVRIIVPRKGDHWYVHAVTRSNYGALLSAGVKIYEYEPGFIHAKMMVSDDSCAVIGTVNMDFRSFYLHYENAVWMCGTPMVQDIKSDILETIEAGEQISLESYMRRPIYLKAVQAALNLFAPLM